MSFASLRDLTMPTRSQVLADSREWAYARRLDRALRGKLAALVVENDGYGFSLLLTSQRYQSVSVEFNNSYLTLNCRNWRPRMALLLRVMRDRQRRAPGGWVLNGNKLWITHGISGQVAVVIVRTGELLDSRGMTAFVVERGTPGFLAGKKENKLGMRASETAEMIFDNCRIHKSQILGEEGEGFIQSMKILDGGRISIAALSLGIAKGAYEASVKYAKERHQFGQPIGNFQGISFKLADMATKIEAAELLTRQAGHLKDAGKKCTKQAAMAKYYASEISVQVSTDAIQVHGGYGYTKDFPVEKFYRDSKLCTIGEGTSEIQKLVISREAMKE